MAQVQIIVTGVSEAEAFYTTCLGLKLHQQFGPVMAIVAKGDLTLWLAGPEASASLPMPGGAQPGPGAGCGSC